MIEHFSFAHYRFTFIPKDTIRMPAHNKGNVLRGAFGSSLRRLVCSMDKGADCNSCVLKEKCAYALIFSPVGIIDAKRLRNSPRGYVLKPPLPQDTEYTSSSPLKFDMLLVGDRVKYLSYVVVPFVELGKVGIGLNRGKFRLGDIESLKGGVTTTIYDSSTNTVKDKKVHITGEELMKTADAFNKDSITLRFLTPTRIKYNPTNEKGKSRVVRTPEFHHIIRRLRDRIDALSRAYCGRALDIDFGGIAERAMNIRTRSVGLKWLEIKRKSRTQRTTHDQSGFVGSITFEGDLKEFLPLLILGEYVHVGDDAVFGNGWYRIEDR
jgi:CRISPR-associated endoribonuclease Cas6